MRTLTAAQQETLAARFRNISVRVYVDSGGGVFVNLSDLEGYDWVRSASWDENIDQPISSATIALSRAMQELNLSPFYGKSKLNNGAKLLDTGRQIYIDTATTPLGVTAAESDYTRAWQGYIDSVDPTPEAITLQCRDQGAVLVDTFIEAQADYGAEEGAAITSVLQALLDNHLGAGVVPLKTIGTPTFLILPYTQAKEPLMEALRKLAMQIGWDVRYRWDNLSDSFKLTFWAPERENTSTPAHIFSPDDIIAVRDMRISREDVRNVVVINYLDANLKTRQSVALANDSSILKYGRRYMEITEAATSQIDSAEEAAAMAYAALADLREPNAELQIELDYFWPAELGDLYAFLADGVFFDSTQYFAVVAIQHSLAESAYSTTLTVRGRPASAYRSWLGIEGRVGVAPTGNMLDPSAPQNVAIAQKPLGFTLAHDLPAMPERWSRTEVYITTHPTPISQVTTGGKHGPPSGTLAASARATLISVDNLLAEGETHRMFNVAAVLVDSSGNYSAKSATLPVNVTRIGPSFENTDSAAPNLLRNGDFNIFTRGTDYPPDFWSVMPGWHQNPLTGTDNWGIWHVQGSSGTHAIELWARPSSFPVGEMYITSDFIPFPENDVIAVMCSYKYTGAPLEVTTQAYLHVAFYGFDAFGDYTLLGVGTSGGVIDTGGEWNVGLTGAFYSPAETRYVRVSAYMKEGMEERIWKIDRIGCSRGSPHLSTYLVSSPSQFASNTDSPMRTRALDRGTVGFVWVEAEKAWKVQVPAYYTLNLQAALHSEGSFDGGDWADLWIESKGEYDASWSRHGFTKCVTNDSGYSTATVTTPALFLQKNTLVRPMINPTETFEVDETKEPQTAFTAVCISRGDGA